MLMGFIYFPARRKWRERGGGNVPFRGLLANLNTQFDRVYDPKYAQKKALKI